MLSAKGAGVSRLLSPRMENSVSGRVLRDAFRANFSGSGGKPCTALTHRSGEDFSQDVVYVRAHARSCMYI